MNKKLMVFSILSSTIIFGTVFIAQKARKTYPHTLSQSFKESLQKSILKEEQRVWHLIEQYGISKKEILKKAEAFPIKSITQFPEYKDLKAPQKEIREFIEETLHSININPNTVHILGRENSSTACNVGNMIIVNEKLFLKHSKSARRFMIIHECGHMNKRDSIVKNMLTAIFNPGMYDIELAQKHPNHPLCQFMRFVEWRADIFALTHTDNTVQGYEAFCTENIKWWGTNFDIPTHPSYAQRLTIAQLAQQYPKMA